MRNQEPYKPSKIRNFALLVACAAGITAFGLSIHNYVHTEDYTVHGDVNEVTGSTNIEIGGTQNDPIVKLKDEIKITKVSAKDNGTLSVGDPSDTAVNVDAKSFSIDAAGDASNITLATDGAGEDLTIAVTGATNSSLILSSSGTGGDALQVTASVGGIDITSAGVMDITTSGSNSNITIDPHGSGTLALGSPDNTAVTADALAITLTSVNALTLTDGTATMALGGTGATSLAGATTVDLDCTGAMSLNSSGGVINVGNDAVAQNINIGTGAAARTITVGNTTGATALDVNLGTGGLTVDCTDGGAISLDANGAPSNLTLASTNDADDLTIEVTGATDSSLILSSTGTGADALQVTASAGGMDITSALAMDITTSGSNSNITIDPHGSGTLALGSADNTAVTADALAITLTSVNALTLTDGTATMALGGTGATSLAGATTVDLDCTGAMSLNSSGGVINVGNDAVEQNINIGTGAAARTITVGNTTGETEIILDSGTGEVKLNSSIIFADAKNIQLNTNTGTKIGTATGQKIGFFNATPVAQQSAPSAFDEADNAATRTSKLNTLRTALVDLGLIA